MWRASILKVSSSTTRIFYLAPLQRLPSSSLTKSQTAIIQSLIQQQLFQKRKRVPLRRHIGMNKMAKMHKDSSMSTQRQVWSRSHRVTQAFLTRHSRCTSRAMLRPIQLCRANFMTKSRLLKLPSLRIFMCRRTALHISRTSSTRSSLFLGRHRL